MNGEIAKAAEARECLVDQEFAQLDQTVSSCEVCVSTLAGKLDRVCRPNMPSDPEPSSEICPPEKQLPPLVKDIAEYTGRLRNILAILSDSLSRLEI